MALETEARAAGRLGAEAIVLLQRFRGPELDADPLFACLAQAMEKVAKLTIGLAEQDACGVWPGLAAMWGHDISQLDARARALLRDSMRRTSPTPYVRGLLDDVDRDAWIDQVLTAVTRYAEQGRFFNLDSLGDRPQTEASPVALWAKLEMAIAKADPALVDGLTSDAVLTSLNATIEESLRRWWELYWRTWANGVIGDEARRVGFQLRLEDNR